MQLGNGVQTLDAYRPTFDPHLDIATVVFSEFDFDAFPDMILFTRLLCRRIGLLDNDEALSLPYERVVGLLGAHAAKYVCDCAAQLGSVRLLKWTRVNNLDWSAHTCFLAAANGHLPALQYLHENGCPWDRYTCSSAAVYKHRDCLQYAVDNKCPEWEIYAKKYAEHLR
jgi:hypothetical protein